MARSSHVPFLDDEEEGQEEEEKEEEEEDWTALCVNDDAEQEVAADTTTKERKRWTTGVTALSGGLIAVWPTAPSCSLVRGRQPDCPHALCRVFFRESPSHVWMSSFDRHGHRLKTYAAA